MKLSSRFNREFWERLRRHAVLGAVGLVSMPLWVVVNALLLYTTAGLAGGFTFFLVPPVTIAGMGGVAYLASRFGVKRVLPVVLLVDAVVVAVLLPNLPKPLGPKERCAENLAVLSRALVAYSQAHSNQLPATLGELVPTYLEALPSCPGAGADSYSSSYAPGVGKFTLFCQGAHHSAEGLPADTPRASF